LFWKYKSNIYKSHNYTISNVKVTTSKCLNNVLRTLVSIFLNVIIEKSDISWTNLIGGPNYSYPDVVIHILTLHFEIFHINSIITQWISTICSEYDWTCGKYFFFRSSHIFYTHVIEPSLTLYLISTLPQPIVVHKRRSMFIWLLLHQLVQLYNLWLKNKNENIVKKDNFEVGSRRLNLNHKLVG